MCVYWLQSLLQCLWLYGPRTEGVFRHCASVKTCRKWRDALDVGCSSLHVDSAYVHVAASLLKVFTPVSCNYRQFLSRVSTLTLDIDIAILSVRPSVRLFVRPWRFDIRWKRLNILSYFSPCGSPIILVLSTSNIFTKCRRGHPCGGDKYRWGLKISRFSTDNSLYLTDDTRYRHSYYGRWIGTRMRSINWCYLQWPWTNPNPVFKVTPLFDSKYLTNGYRYSHSYCRRRIGNCIRGFKWHQFQWPWVTSKPDFKVTILFNVK